MSKEIAVVAGTSLAGSAAFVIHPHAAIGCCFFLAVPWGSDD